MSAARLRIGIAGKRGTCMAAGLRSVSGVEVRAFCERDPVVLRQLADSLEIPLRFERFDEMLDDVDAVVVGTPGHQHATQSILALRAGRHVLSEVTAAVTIEECWRLIDAVRASGRVYMMAENYCYFREIMLVSEMVRKGMFGEPYYGEGEYLHEVRTLHHTPEGELTWRGYWHAGLNGNTYPTHSLGPLMQWFRLSDPTDRIERVVCVGSGVHTDPEHPQADTSETLCTMRSGRLARLRLDMMSNRPHLLWNSLQGTLGCYESSRISGQPGIIWLGDNRAGEHREWRSASDFDEHLPDCWRNISDDMVRAGHGGGDYLVARAFALAVTQGTPPPIDVYDAVEWTAAGLCSQLSIENHGVPIQVPDFRNPAARPVWLDLSPGR